MPDSRPGGDSLDSAAMRTADLESTFRLIERARAGDQEALDRLMVRHLSRSGAGPRADDLVQDTLLQTFKRIGVFEVRGPGCPFGTSS